MHLFALIVEKFMDLWNKMFFPCLFLCLLDFLFFFCNYLEGFKNYLFSNLKIKSDAFYMREMFTYHPAFGI